MYKIKQSPEDFIVKEISEVKLSNCGAYAICILKKRNYTVIRAIEQIASLLHKGTNDIGFAGIKDKNAVTEQLISIKDATREDIEGIRLKDISLEFKGYSDKPIVLGDLIENEFVITIRDLTCKEINSLKSKINKNKKITMPNFFGEQRFSERNIDIGRLLVKSDFEKALDIILKTNSDYKAQIEESLERNPRNFVAALKIIPKRLLILYVHAYQSCLWNLALKEYIKNIRKKKANKNQDSKRSIDIPIAGFGTEIGDDRLKLIIGRIMEKEGISFRSFINRAMPEISPEGALRNAFAEIECLKIIEEGRDFVKLSFKLKKGSYATVAVDFLISA